jgi:hypothetical protein
MGRYVARGPINSNDSAVQIHKTANSSDRESSAASTIRRHWRRLDAAIVQHQRQCVPTRLRNTLAAVRNGAVTQTTRSFLMRQ